MQATHISLLTLTLIAVAVLTEHRFVTAGGAVPGAGANALGVVNNNAAIGEKVAADVLGTTLVEASAAIAAGAAIETTATGTAVTKSAGVTLGRALSAATAAGQLIEVLLIPN